MRFSDLDMMAGAACERTFSESVRITPRVAAQYSRPTPDPSRPIREVRGTPFISASLTMLRTGGGKSSAMGQHQAGQDAQGRTFAGAPARVWLSADAACGLGYAVRKGDLIELLDRPAQPQFAVAVCDPHDGGDATLHLVIEGDAYD